MTKVPAPAPTMTMTMRTLHSRLACGCIGKQLCSSQVDACVAHRSMQYYLRKSLWRNGASSAHLNLTA
jgi:hypothetical protein